MNDAETTSAPTDAIVDRWFAKYFHGLGVRLETALYNELYAAKDDLKQQLRAAAPE